MKNTVRNIAVGLLLSFLAAGLVLFPKEAASAAGDSVTLCLQVIIPSLFPFFVVTSLIINAGLGDTFGKALSPVLEPLLGLRGSAASAFVLGLIGGYPAGARAVVSLYENGLCGKRDAERMLAFCNNCGPAFILGVAGGSVFGSGLIGFLLLLSHIIGASCVGLIFRDPQSSANTAPRSEVARPGFAESFVDAVSTSFSSTVRLCGFIIFFSVLIRLLSVSGVIPLLAVLSPADRIFTGVLEISAGVWQFKDMAASETALSAALVSFILGFGGISVYCQVLSIIGGSGISSKLYLIGKLLHGMISAAVAFILIGLFLTDGAQQAGIFGFLPAGGGIIYPALAVIVLIFSVCILPGYGKKCGKKRKKAL